MNSSFVLPLSCFLLFPVSAVRCTLLSVRLFESPSNFWGVDNGGLTSVYDIPLYRSEHKIHTRLHGQGTQPANGRLRNSSLGLAFLLYSTAYLVDNLFPFYFIVVLSKWSWVTMKMVIFAEDNMVWLVNSAFFNLMCLCWIWQKSWPRWEPF